MGAKSPLAIAPFGPAVLPTLGYCAFTRDRRAVEWPRGSQGAPIASRALIGPGRSLGLHSTPRPGTLPSSSAHQGAGRRQRHLTGEMGTNVRVFFAVASSNQPETTCYFHLLCGCHF